MKFRVYAEIEILDNYCDDIEVVVDVNSNDDEEIEKKAIEAIKRNLKINVTNIIDEEE